MVNSLRFGRTLHAAAQPDAALPIIVDSLVRSGYKLRSDPTQLPIQLKWGSLAIDIVGQATADFLPLAIIPGFWKKSMPAKVTVSILDSAEAGTYFRIDSQPLMPAGSFATPHFSKHVDAAVASLNLAGIVASAWPVSDSTPSISAE